MHQMIPSFEFRRRARVAMKPVMSVLVMVALIASLPSLINSTVTLLANADPSAVMTDFTNRLLQIMEDASLTTEQIVQAVQQAQDDYFAALLAFAKEKGLLIVLMGLMVAVCSPVLTMGMLNTLLQALRKQPVTAALALSRVRYVLKAVGLMLLFALMILLRMLPGIAVSIIGIFLPAGSGLLVMIVGMILAIIMGIRASYSYAMAVFIMADEPASGVRECLRRSKEVMLGRRMELFSLELSFIGWHLLLSLVQSFLTVFGVVISMTLGMFASLFLTVYSNCAQAAFYQEYVVGPLPAGESEIPAEDELN